eukprot:596143-Rhodomonas_salina.2
MSHFYLAAHSFTLAAIQGVLKGDLRDVTKDALANAETVTPVGAHFMREHIPIKNRTDRVYNF